MIYGAPRADRIIAIGDIHGCSIALAALLEIIEPTPKDMLITLGDLIDCGPDSRGVVELLIALAKRCQLVSILGNHEEMLLAATQSTSVLKEWLFCGGIQTLRSYGVEVKTTQVSDILLNRIIPEEHWRFLANSQPYAETPTHIFTHAGYRPDMPMARQSASALRWEWINSQKVQPHCSGKVVVVGHTTQRSGEILDLGFLKCLDTGCEPGRWLTALDTLSGQVWQTNKRGEVRKRGRNVSRCDTHFPMNAANEPDA